LTRQPIWKFFSGKPIERHIFLEICFRLDLIGKKLPVCRARPTDCEEQDNCGDIGGLVQKVRAHRRDKIQAQCGTIRLLIAQLIELNDIYVSVNILEAL